jgi:hypothetical protein
MERTAKTNDWSAAWRIPFLPDLFGGLTALDGKLPRYV